MRIGLELYAAYCHKRIRRGVGSRVGCFWEGEGSRNESCEQSAAADQRFQFTIGVREG